MTPTESREVVLGLSRERLARATARLERIALDAAERIVHLKQDKNALERRLAEMATLIEQERQNFEQRAALLSSVTTETAERKKEFDDLTCRLNDQDRLLNEQIETISKLEGELENRAGQLREQQNLEAAWKSELAEWKLKTEQLEERLEKTSKERDGLKSKIYDDERVAAQYALHLTSDDRDKAARAIDTLIDQLATIETRAMITNGK